MRKFTKTLSLLSLVFLVYGCAIHTGNITTAPQGADFTYVGQAVGQAKTTHILGIGGIRREALTYEAKQNLIQNRPLGKNEAYANFVVDVKQSFWLVAIITRTTVTADIIRYGEAETANRYDGYYILNQRESPYRTMHNVNDTVYDSSGRAYRIKGYTQKGMYVAQEGRKGNRLKILPFKKAYVHVKDLAEKSARLMEQEKKKDFFKDAPFSLGDTVFARDFTKYLLIGSNSEDLLVFDLSKSSTVNGVTRLTQVKNSKVFISSRKTYRQYTLGQEFELGETKYTIVAFGMKGLLASSNDLSKRFISYKMIKTTE